MAPPTPRPGDEVSEDEECGTAEEVQVAQAAQAPDARPLPLGFFISTSQGGRMRRLHFAGGCFRIAGEHIRAWEDVGQSPPAQHLYTARCKDCFPPNIREEQAPEDSDSDDGSTSSSSSGVAASVAADESGQLIV